MKTLIATGSAMIATCFLATAGFAQDADAIDSAIEARQSHMQLYAFNLAILGGMAQGEVAYDSDAAQAAADNLLALASLNQSSYWPEGSDSESVEDSNALPAIWEDMAGVMSASADLQTAAQAMADGAGSDLESLQAAMQGLGAGCGGCHRTYRVRN